MAATRPASSETDGKVLTIKTAPIKFTRPGQDIISTLNFVRVE